MRISSNTQPTPDKLFELVLNNLEQCCNVAPLIGDPAVTEQLQAVFDLCLERFCELERAKLERQITEGRRPKRYSG